MLGLQNRKYILIQLPSYFKFLQNYQPPLLALLILIAVEQTHTAVCTMDLAAARR